MPTITGTTGNDTLTVLTDTSSVQAGAGTDTIVFSGNYTDYTFSQSDSYVSILTHNTTEQAVSLYGVEQLQFDDTTASLKLKTSSKFEQSTHGFTTTIDGGEFQVNTTVDSYHQNPSITGLNDGGFIITWNSAQGIYAQRYDANGDANGTEFKVTTSGGHLTTTDLDDGGFVITWQSYTEDGDFWGIFAQIFNADGSTQGSEFQVNTYTTRSLEDSSITTLSDGGFIITWSSAQGISAQRYDANGDANGTEFKVNTYPSGNGSITADLDDDGFVITWHSSDGDGNGVYAQRYDTNGNRVGAEFKVNTYTIDQQQDSSITALNNGGFVVTWSSAHQDEINIWGIFAQIFNADGSTQGSEFQVNTYTTSSQQNSSITTLSDGGFVVTWESYGQDGSLYGIYAQMYNADGTTQGSEFRVNTYTNIGQLNSSITALSDGGFVVAWELFFNEDGIYAQRYDAEGNALGEASLNAPLALSSAISDASTNEDVGYSYNASQNFSDADGAETLTYSATFLNNGGSSDLPSWLSINSTSGILSGTPANDDTGIYNIKIIATDSGNATASDTFYLLVNQVNDAPTLSGDFTGSVTKGVETNTATGTLVATDVDGTADPFEHVYFDLSNYTTGSDELGNETRTYTNPLGDSRVTTYKQEEIGPRINLDDLTTLANGEWLYSSEGEPDVITDSRGTNVEVINNDDVINGSVFMLGQLFTNFNFSEDDFQGTMTNANGVSGIILSNNNEDIVLLTQGSYGIDSVSVFFLFSDSGVVYTIQEQLGTYGTLALDKNANWTYTLDNTDSDTIGLVTGENAIDSFIIDVSDGYETISQQIDVSVIVKALVVITGTTDNDEISTGLGADVVYALAGNDIITLTADSTWGSNYSAKNVSNDNSVGTEEKISLEGLNRFKDVIDGGDDVDMLNLTAGNDAFFIDDVYSEHHSSLTLSSTTQGTDSTARVIDLETINAGEGNDIVDLSSTNFILSNAVTINGEAGNDSLWGSNGNDVINGGDGNDTIFGGAGNDTLTGGRGADSYQFTATSASNVITDFVVIYEKIKLYYRSVDNHSNDDLSLSNGVLTWSAGESNNVLIDMSATTTSSDLNDVDSLITFVEIV